MSAYYLEHASVDHLQKHFDFFEEESRRLLSSGLAIPAYVYAILYIYHISLPHCLFNVLSLFPVILLLTYVL
jgi:glycyl-tRNA synthetase alpha subunit